MLKSAVPMSKAGNPQRRTTYLISLTLVKVEAVPEDVAASQSEALPEGEGSPKKKEEKEEEDEKKQEEKEETEEGKERSDDPEREEEPVGAQTAGKESTQVAKGADQVRVNYGSTVVCWGKNERKETPQKDPGAAGKSKDTPFVQPPVRQMVKVYGSSTSEGTVRREGPRSEALRPKTELYREPPVLFLKGENGAELGSRSRSSLPFSISPQVGPHPDVVMRQHAGGNSACWKDVREANTGLYHSAKTLDRRENRIGDQSPLMAATTLGPYRASWADSDGRGTLIRPGAPVSGGYSGIMTRDSPQGERFKTVSISLSAPAATDTSRPQRKGTSRTLDNSDLHSLSEDQKKGKEGQGGTIQRAPPRDRKMLKFISGIFTKSAAAAPSANTTPPLYPAVERGSSEEEGKASVTMCNTHTAA